MLVTLLYLSSWKIFINEKHQNRYFISEIQTFEDATLKKNLCRFYRVPFKSITWVQIKWVNIREETCLIFFWQNLYFMTIVILRGGNYLSRWLHTQDYLRQKLSPFLVKKYDLIYIFILKLLWSLEMSLFLCY